MAKGRKPPPWYLDKPELNQHTARLFEAFWDLSTERPGREERIPCSASRAYAREELGLGPQMTRILWRLVKEIDVAYLNWMRGEHDRHRRMNETKGGRGKRKSYTR